MCKHPALRCCFPGKLVKIKASPKSGWERAQNGSVKVKRGRQKGDGKKNVRKCHDIFCPVPFPASPSDLHRMVRSGVTAVQSTRRTSAQRPPNTLCPLSESLFGLSLLLTSFPGKQTQPLSWDELGPFQVVSGNFRRQIWGAKTPRRKKQFNL